jgi:hypothetical protein
MNEFIEHFSYRKLEEEHFCYTIISNVNIVDAANNTIQTNKNVLLHDNIIFLIQDAKKRLPRIPKGTCVLKIDGTGKFLAPGLCDMHVHYICATRNRFEYILEGITTIRNVNGLPVHFQEQEFLENQEIIGPNLYSTSAEIINPHQRDSLFQKDSSSFYKGTYYTPWLYLNHSDSLKQNLDFAKQHRLPISIDAQELPEMNYPNGTVFEQFSGFDFLAKQSNYNSFWFLSKFAYYNKLQDFQQTIFPINEMEKSMLKLMKINSDHFCIGTESGGTFRHSPISGLLPEMEFLSSKGVSNSSIIKMATQNAGAMIQETSNFFNYEIITSGLQPYSYLPFGKIQVGYRADLLLLTANPLEKIANYGKINSIFLNGTYLSPDDITEMKNALNKF